MNWKLHIVSFLVFLFSLGAVKLIWDNPKIILYVILSAIAFLAYGAIYLIVKAKMDNSEKRE